MSISKIADATDSIVVMEIACFDRLVCVYQCLGGTVIFHMAQEGFCLRAHFNHLLQSMLIIFATIFAGWRTGRHGGHPITSIHKASTKQPTKHPIEISEQAFNIIQSWLEQGASDLPF